MRSLGKFPPTLCGRVGDGDALNVALLIPESRRVVPRIFDEISIRPLQLSGTSGGIQASVSAGGPTAER